LIIILRVYSNSEERIVLKTTKSQILEQERNTYYVHDKSTAKSTASSSGAAENS
jgi:hypothetical protein